MVQVLLRLLQSVRMVWKVLSRLGDMRIGDRLI